MMHRVGSMIHYRQANKVLNCQNDFNVVISFAEQVSVNSNCDFPQSKVQQWGLGRLLIIHAKKQFQNSEDETITYSDSIEIPLTIIPLVIISVCNREWVSYFKPVILKNNLLCFHSMRWLTRKVSECSKTNNMV